MKQQIITIIALFLVSATIDLLFATTASATSFDIEFVLIADSNTPAPGSSGNFSYVRSGAISGDNIVLIGNSSIGEGVYLHDGAEINLVADNRSAVPGGTGNFFAFQDAAVDLDTVVFTASERVLVPNVGFRVRFGIYSNVGGLNVVVNHNSPIPDGDGTFAGFVFGGTADGEVVFQGRDADAVQEGVYAATIGGEVRKVADRNTLVPGLPNPLQSLDNPVIDNGKVAFVGQYDAGGNVFQTRSFTDLGGNLHQMPPDDFSPPLIDDGLIYFSGNGGIPGDSAIFSYDGNSTSMLIDENTPGPGGDTLDDINLFSVDNGRLLFFAVDSTSGLGLYLYLGNCIKKVLGIGDPLGDGTVLSLSLRRYALSGGSLVFDAAILKDTGEVEQNAVYRANFPATPQRFCDVPTDYWASAFITTLADSGITAGCGNSNYCPVSPVTRAQMAVFLERGIHGSDFTPPPAVGNVFLDVGAGDFAARFIEQFFLDGITAGCGNRNYCPNAKVTRAQMAIFLLRAKYGAGYSPPAATGVFNDVPLSHWAIHWIEQLAAEGITAGCGNNNYCPDATVNRDQMAVFLVRTFDL